MTEIGAEAGPPTRNRSAWAIPLLLLLLGLGLYLPFLGASGLWDPWEPKYAQTAREMAAEGEWIIPHYLDDERLNKAPVTYWLIAASQAVFGVTETGARMPSALLAVFAAALLGWALAARGRTLEGLLAGAALLTGPQWHLLGRFATPDIPLAALLAAALALALTPAGKRRRVAVPLVVALTVAAAGMTDWPRGLLLPLWAVLGWAALRWSWKGPLALAAVAALYHTAQLTYSVPLNLAAAALALALALLVLRLRAGVSWPVLLVAVALIVVLLAPWFVIAPKLEPEEWSLYRYKYAFNLGETVERHTGPYHYVIGIVGFGGLPWSALALIGLGAALGRRADPQAAVLAGAWLGGVLFFSLSEAQMGHFYGVLQPATAGLAAIGGVRLIRRPDWTVVPAIGAWAWLLALVWKKPWRILETATVKSGLFGADVAVVVAASIVAWALVVVAARIGGRASWLSVAVVPAAILSGTFALDLVPDLAGKKSLEEAWDTYVERREGDEPLGLWGRHKDSIFYYSNDTVHRLHEPEEARQFLEGPGVKFLIGTQSALQTAAGLTDATMQPLMHTHPTHRLARFVPPRRPAVAAAPDGPSALDEKPSP